MSTKGRCAITGASGYVGSQLKGYLSRDGWDVVEMTRRKTEQGLSAPGSLAYSLQEKVDPAVLKGVDALIHCAWDFRCTTWKAIEETNVRGSIQLLEAAAQAGVKRILFISTMSAYDKCTSMYGRAKLQIEEAALRLGAIVIRPGLVYGPSPGGVFGKLANVVQKFKFVPLVGFGNQILYLTYEEDLEKLLSELAGDRTQNIAAPITAAASNGMTFRQILTTIAAAHGRKPIFIPISWYLIYGMLRGAEMTGLPLGFRSDSLISLLNQNPHPDFSVTKQVGVPFRPFRPDYSQASVTHAAP